MSFKPLLPLVDGGTQWDAQGKKAGLNAEQYMNFMNRLYNVSTIETSGVPSLLSHPFVVHSRLISGDRNAFDTFSLLVKGLFLGVLNIRNVTGRLGQVENVAQKVEPNFTTYLLLEMKYQPHDSLRHKNRKFSGGVRSDADGFYYVPIGGMHPDCLVFPGAMFESGECFIDIEKEDKGVSVIKPLNFNLARLRDEVERAENMLGSAIVRVLFSKWIDEISTTMKLPDGVGAPIWLQTLCQIRGAWASPVIPPLTALSDWTRQLKQVQVSDHTQNLRTIPIRSVSWNIFCEKVIRFYSGKMPDLPVKSEYLNLIDDCQRVGDTYEITLKGWSGAVSWTPQEVVDGKRASILLWPDFKAPGWNVNYTMLCPSSEFKGHKPSLSVLNFDGQNRPQPLAEIKEEPGFEPGCLTNQEITHIEIRCNGVSTGIFADPRPIIGSAGGNRRVALDFGTVHTSLALWDGQRNAVLPLQDMTTDILDRVNPKVS